MVDSGEGALDRRAAHLRHLRRTPSRAATAPCEALRELQDAGWLRSDWRPLRVESLQVRGGGAAAAAPTPSPTTSALLRIPLEDDVPGLALRLERQQL